MARKARKLTDLQFYHVIMRGNNQQELFYDQNDKERFIKKLEEYVLQLGIILYSYTLMNNHIHLEVGNANKTMAILVKKLACSYVPYFNKKYKRTGHLFQGRYTSIPIYDTEQFMDTAGYIINNPEIAGICRHDKYKWSSYHHYFSHKKTSKFINSEYLIKISGSEKKLKYFFKYGWKKPDNKFDNLNPHNDEIVIQFLKQLLNLENLLELQKLDKYRKTSYLKAALRTGLPVTQLLRLFDIPKGILYKMN